jgi:hypothetical protein
MDLAGLATADPPCDGLHLNLLVRIATCSPLLMHRSSKLEGDHAITLGFVDLMREECMQTVPGGILHSGPCYPLCCLPSMSSVMTRVFGSVEVL